MRGQTREEKKFAQKGLDKAWKSVCRGPERQQGERPQKGRGSNWLSARKRRGEGGVFGQKRKTKRVD